MIYPKQYVKTITAMTMMVVGLWILIERGRASESDEGPVAGGDETWKSVLGLCKSGKLPALLSIGPRDILLFMTAQSSADSLGVQHNGTVPYFKRFAYSVEAPTVSI